MLMPRVMMRRQERAQQPMQEPGLSRLAANHQTEADGEKREAANHADFILLRIPMGAT